jgi:beta-lactamase class A
MRRLAILLALAFAPAALASDAALHDANARYGPAARASYARTPDGAQARYDAGRNLVEAVLAAGPVSRERRALRAELLAQGRRAVARAERLDRDPGFSSLGPLAPLPGVGPGVGPSRLDVTLARRLAAAAATANGAVGIWVHELGSGRYAGHQADARFAAASTVKLGALVAALGAAPRPERSRWWYDVRQIGFWSSTRGESDPRRARL